MVISMLKIRRPLGRLIFNMGIAIPGKTVFLIETATWTPNANFAQSIMTKNTNFDWENLTKGALDTTIKIFIQTEKMLT